MSLGKQSSHRFYPPVKTPPVDFEVWYQGVIAALKTQVSDKLAQLQKSVVAQTNPVLIDYYKKVMDATVKVRTIGQSNPMDSDPNNSMSNHENR